KAIPASLVGATSVGVVETKEAEAFYENGAHADDSFDFKAYKSADVNAALTAEFHGKCAYCESPYEATHPVDIEHYRPKGGYVKDNKLTKPGYYWLAADWMNLLPSCIDCNRRRRQKFKDEPEQLAGKANLFPIADETKRATRPRAERRGRQAEPDGGGVDQGLRPASSRPVEGPERALHPHRWLDHANQADAG